MFIRSSTSVNIVLGQICLMSPLLFLMTTKFEQMCDVEFFLFFLSLHYLFGVFPVIVVASRVELTAVKTEQGWRNEC